MIIKFTYSSTQCNTLLTADHSDVLIDVCIFHFNEISVNLCTSVKCCNMKGPYVELTHLLLCTIFGQ